MAPGALDPVTKELIYIAVSIVNGCEYCIHSHTAVARKKGMTEEMRSELLSVIAMASQTNALANAYQIEVDDIDSHAFIFNLENAPEGMEIDENGLITWTPGEGVLSSNYLTV